MTLPTSPAYDGGEIVPKAAPDWGTQVRSRWQLPLQILAAFLLFSLIAFLRHTDAFFYPVLYAEDGMWMGRIMTEGFPAIVLDARPDYMVAALVALEGVSLFATRILFGLDISALPQVVAVTASLAFGLVATLPLLTLSDRMPPVYCWLMGFAIALLPVGDDGFQIFGRILNLGFYMPVIAQFVLFAILYRKPSVFAAILLQAAALFLMWSFPVVIGQYFVFIVFDAFMRQTEGIPVVVPLAAHVAVLILGTLSFDPMLIASPGGVPLPFEPDALIEFTVARAAIFPIVAAFYDDLTDGWTIATLTLVLAVTGLYVRRIGLHSIRLLDHRVFFVVNFGVIWLATLVMRRGLSSLLDNYQTSSPDRYFTGVNIMFMTALMVLCLSVPSVAYRRVGGAISLALIVSWFFTQPLFGTPWTERSLGTLRDTVCSVAAGDLTGFQASSPIVDLPIYPDILGRPWRISIPLRTFEETVREQCPS